MAWQRAKPSKVHRSRQRKTFLLLLLPLPKKQLIFLILSPTRCRVFFWVIFHVALHSLLFTLKSISKRGALESRQGASRS